MTTETTPFAPITSASEDADLSPRVGHVPGAGLLARAVSALDLPILVINGIGTVVWTSPALCDLFGFDQEILATNGLTGEEVLSRVASHLVASDDFRHLAARASKGERINGHPVRTRNGITLEVDCAPIALEGSDPDGQVWMFKGRIAGGTPSRLDDNTLELRALLDSSPELIFVVNRDKTLGHFNAAFERLMRTRRGISPQPGMNIADWARFDTDGRWAAAFLKAFSGQSHSCDWPLVEEDRIAQLEVAMHPNWHNGEVESVSVFIQDRTAKDVFRERALLHTERLARTLSATGAMPYEWHLQSGVLTAMGVTDVTGYPYGPSAQSLKWWLSHVPAYDRAPLLAELKVIIEQRDSFELDYHFEHSDGRLIYLWNKGVVMRNSEGKAIMIQGIVRDISSRRSMELELMRAKERAEEMSRLKTSFLANMSHELRTPLTAILGYTDILRDVTELPEHKRYLDSIERSSNRLLRNVNLLIDLAQIETGQAKLTLEPCDVQLEIGRIIDELMPLATERNLYLKQLDAPMPLWLMADKLAFAQIMINLLGNAIKFTESGGVTVAIARESGNREPESNTIRIDVVDSGIGIDKGFQTYIFDEFRQESSGYGRRFGGNGLGLTITRKLVIAMGGSISLWSEKGLGSRFTIQLPEYQPGRTAVHSGEPA